MIKNFIKENTVLIGLCFLALLRLISLGLYPLMDKTEARYAEISREMVMRNDWITPWLEGKPFWAKPPLSMWLVNISYKIFGINEFSARFPSFLLAILSMFLIFILARQLKDKEFGSRVVLILFSMGLFFIIAGGVMTDPALCFSMTLSLVSFILMMKGINVKIFRYLFFVSLGLSMLAKGPIGIVLTFMPIFFWTLIYSEWKNLFKQLFFIPGIILMILIFLPWYLVAESKTPGFLKYYFIGEHFLRYTVKGWKGDLYGTPNSAPFGSIWLYALPTFLPWLFLYFAKLKSFAKILRENLFKDKNLAFLFLWILCPLIFFSFSKNILITYLLPATPAFAILTAYLLDKINFSLKKIIIISMIVPFISVMALIFVLPEIGVQRSQKTILRKYNNGDMKIYYVDNMPYSAYFYGQNNTELISSKNLDSKFEELLNDNKKYYFVVEKDKLHIINILSNYADFEEQIGEYQIFK